MGAVSKVNLIKAPDLCMEAWLPPPPLVFTEKVVSSQTTGLCMQDPVSEFPERLPMGQSNNTFMLGFDFERVGNKL